MPSWSSEGLMLTGPWSHRTFGISHRSSLSRRYLQRDRRSGSIGWWSQWCSDYLRNVGAFSIVELSVCHPAVEDFRADLDPTLKPLLKTWWSDDWLVVPFYSQDEHRRGAAWAIGKHKDLLSKEAKSLSTFFFRKSTRKQGEQPIVERSCVYVS